MSESSELEKRSSGSDVEPPKSGAPEADPESLLSEREAAALRYFRATPTQRPVDPSFNAKLFELWLNGCDTAEIHRLNPALSLGQIVHARVKGEWDRRKEEHLSRLLDETAGRFRQVTLESVGFVANMMAAANKLHGDAIKTFLQTGNAADLGALRIDSLASYQKAVDLLMKLTGQDKQQKLSIAAEVVHHEAGARVPMSPAQASQAIRRLRGR